MIASLDAEDNRQGLKGTDSRAASDSWPPSTPTPAPCLSEGAVKDRSDECRKIVPGAGSGGIAPTRWASSDESPWGFLAPFGVFAKPPVRDGMTQGAWLRVRRTLLSLVIPPAHLPAPGSPRMGCLPVLVLFKGAKAVSPRRAGLSARTGCRQAWERGRKPEPRKTRGVRTDRVIRVGREDFLPPSTSQNPRAPRPKALLCGRRRESG